MEAKRAGSGVVVRYPDSDGKPMADNTLQFRWIATIKGNLDAMLPDDFVAGDLLWYPVEGSPSTRIAPDVLVALGRPKGERGSYKQWEEAGVAPQVAFEVLSPSNTTEEMAEKRALYQLFGVLELYIYDPDSDLLEGWIRKDPDHPFVSRDVRDWTSPLLGIRFDNRGEVLAIYRRDGQRFLSFGEMEQRLREEQHRATAAEQRAARLAAQLRALGIEPDA